MMDTHRILAKHTLGKVHLRMLGTSLRQVFAVGDDGSFNDLLRRLDAGSEDRINQQAPTPRP